MDQRKEIRDYIENALFNYATPVVRPHSNHTADVVMRALDEYVEEHFVGEEFPSSSSFNIGDKVQLKQKLEEFDGSTTDRTCCVTNSMADISTEETGTITHLGAMNGEDTAFVEFSTSGEWWIAIADLKEAE